jgi:chromosome segregation ATPase
MGNWLGRSQTEKQLAKTVRRVREIREKLAVAEEQLAALREDAEDLEMRSMVSESPFDSQESRQASAHAASMHRHRDDLRRELSELESRQDELLDRMNRQ